MSFNRNLRPDYWGTQNTSSSGSSLSGNVRHLISFSNDGTRNPASQSRQDYLSPTDQDCGPPNRKDYLPPPKYDYGLGTRRDYVPAMSRYNEPPSRQGCISPNRIDHGSYRQNCGSHNAQALGYQIKQDFGSPSRSDNTPQTIRQYGSQVRQESGLQNYGLQNIRDLSPQNKKDYYPQREDNSQRNQAYGSQDKRDYDALRRSDYDSQYSHVYGSQSRQEYTYGQDHRKDNKSYQKIGGNKRRFRGNTDRTVPPHEENFCEYCKILCNGQKAYKVHCTTDRHKKQEQLAIERTTILRDPVRSAYLMCPLCEVFCPDSFSYKGHLRGSKHKQVLSLYKKMNKPIPQFNMHAVKAEADKRALPVGEEFIVECPSGFDGVLYEDKVFCKLCNRQISEHNKIGHCKGREHRSNYVLKLKEERQRQSVENCDTNNDSRPFAEDDSSYWIKEENCKIRNAESYQDNDGGNSKVEETSQKNRNPIKCEVCNLSCPDEYTYSLHIRGSQHRREVTYQRRFHGIRVSRNQMKAEKAEALANIPLIGVEYIVLRESESDGKSAGDPNQLYCKLCDCQLNLKSKDRHLKGKRHRLAYKEKVDPNLPELIREKNVPWKLFLKQKKEEQKSRNLAENSTTNQDIEPSSVNRVENTDVSENIVDEEDNDVNPPTYADRHITLKEEAIYPEESILQNIEQSISDCEEALKSVRCKISDCTAEGAKNNDHNNSVKTSELQKDNQFSESISNVEECKDTEDDDVNCAIKVVIRIGCFAKDIMLKGENTSFLVVLCEELPSVLLLNNIYKLFCQELKVNAGEDKYTINLVSKDATIVVATKSDSNIVIINITFTSTKLTEAIRTQKESLLNEEIDYCDKPLDALVQLRRTRWFKVKLEDHQNCIVLLRVLRAMCKENQTWSTLSCWVLELLLERVFSKAEDQSVGGIMRKFLEALSAGIILPDSCGISDPCEKEPTDAADYLTLQQKVDITTTAQFILRRMAFNFINAVLNTTIPPEESQFIPSGDRTPVAVKRSHEDMHEKEGNESKKVKTATAE